MSEFNVNFSYFIFHYSKLISVWYYTDYIESKK